MGGYLTKTGLRFEEVVDIGRALGNLETFKTVGNKVYYGQKPIAEVYSKNDLYKFLENKKVDYKKIVSKKLLPDMAVFVYQSRTFFIFEVKYQGVGGSTDEKLQTCDFKIKQYRKLLEKPLGYKVKYIYVLNDWFRDPGYKDVLDYIKTVEGCDYLFNKVPLEYLGLK